MRVLHSWASRFRQADSACCWQLHSDCSSLAHCRRQDCVFNNHAHSTALLLLLLLYCCQAGAGAQYRSNCLNTTFLRLQSCPGLPQQVLESHVLLLRAFGSGFNCDRQSPLTECSCSLQLVVTRSALWPVQPTQHRVPAHTCTRHGSADRAARAGVFCVLKHTASFTSVQLL